MLKEVGYAITRLPEDFTPHRAIRRVYDARRAMIETGEGIDWGMAEALAFGTLLSEGAPTQGDGMENFWRRLEPASVKSMDPVGASLCRRAVRRC